MDKRYVLRKPIEAHYVSDSNEWYIEILGYLNNGEFDEMFVEFSFDATQKQIEEILYNFGDDMFNRGNSISLGLEKLQLVEDRPIWEQLKEDIIDPATKPIVDELLDLLGGTTNE